MSEMLWAKGLPLDEQLHAFTVGDDPVIEGDFRIRFIVYFDFAQRRCLPLRRVDTQTQIPGRPRLGQEPGEADGQTDHRPRADELADGRA